MWSSMRKALAVGRKEFRQIARDRRTLMVLLFVPAFFLLVYGYALSFDVQNIQIAVLDNDRSQASRDLVNAFVKSGYFQLNADVSSTREYETLIDRGDVRAALVIPAGLQRDLLTGHRVPVQVIVNGDNSNTATTVIGYALSVLQTASAQYQAQANRGGATALTSNRACGKPHSEARCSQPASSVHRQISSVVRRRFVVVKKRGDEGRCGWRRSAPARTSSARRCRTSPSRWRPRCSSCSPRCCCSDFQ